MVKCEDCGFLAERSWGTGHYDVADRPRRETGHPPKPEVLPTPHCLRDVIDIPKTVLNLQSTGRTEPGALLEVLRTGRVCSDYVRWRPGLSIKEHYEMKMLDQQREWQVRQEERQREWMEKQSGQRLRWEIVIFGGGVTVILAAATIVAAFIQRGGGP